MYKTIIIGLFRKVIEGVVRGKEQELCEKFARKVHRKGVRVNQGDSKIQREASIAMAEFFKETNPLNEIFDGLEQKLFWLFLEHASWLPDIKEEMKLLEETPVPDEVDIPTAESRVPAEG